MAEPRRVCLRAVAIPELHRPPGRPNQLLGLPLPSAVHRETRPYEVFEKDSHSHARMVAGNISKTNSNSGSAIMLRYNLKTVRAYLLKEAFQQLWDYNSPDWAGKFLDEWCPMVKVLIEVPQNDHAARL